MDRAITDFSINDLKYELNKLNLPTTGNKSVLYDRLKQYYTLSTLNIKELSNILTNLSISPNGVKSDLIHRILNNNDIILPNLTGNRDADRTILLNLPDNDLYTVCSLSKYTRELCNETFWSTRIMDTYDINIYQYNLRIDIDEKLYILLGKRPILDQLIFAIRKGNLDLLALLIDVHLTSLDDLTILLKHAHIRSYNNGLAILEYIATTGHSIYGKYNKKNKPINKIINFMHAIQDIFTTAAANGDIKLVKHMVIDNKDIYNIYGRFPEALTAAAQSGSLELVKYILTLDFKWELQTNRYEFYEDVIITAINYRHINIVIYFIETLGIHVADEFLIAAVSANDIPILSYLLTKYPSDIDNILPELINEAEQQIEPENPVPSILEYLIDEYGYPDNVEQAIYSEELEYSDEDYY